MGCKGGLLGGTPTVRLGLEKASRTGCRRVAAFLAGPNRGRPAPARDRWNAGQSDYLERRRTLARFRLHLKALNITVLCTRPASYSGLHLQDAEPASDVKLRRAIGYIAHASHDATARDSPQISLACAMRSISRQRRLLARYWLPRVVCPASLQLARQGEAASSVRWEGARCALVTVVCPAAVWRWCGVIADWGHTGAMVNGCVTVC
ncbi:hypothetical protein C2E23DRAFT_538811 [Lenzites betulinus]|nr:hypothetical protein C2E23DRAFT_538811 [Lenzites betulinus]